MLKVHSSPYPSITGSEMLDMEWASKAGWLYHSRRCGVGWSRRVPQYWFFLQSCVFRITKNTHLKLKYLNFTDWRGELLVWIGLLKIYSSHHRLGIIFHGFRPKLKKSLKDQFSAVFLIKYNPPIADIYCQEPTYSSNHDLIWFDACSWSCNGHSVTFLPLLRPSFTSCTPY